MNKLISSIILLLINSMFICPVYAQQELTPSQGGQFQKSGRYQVHYIALPSTLLSPKVASAYGIKRSSYNGFINISIIDTLIPGKPAVKGKITGRATNLTGKITKLTFVEVTEGKAIYYIAQLPFRHKEHFTIQVNSVNADGLNSSISFTQEFYAE